MSSIQAKLAPIIGVLSFIFGSQILHSAVQEYFFTGVNKGAIKNGTKAVTSSADASKEDVPLNLPIIEFSAFFNKEKVFIYLLVGLLV